MSCGMVKKVELLKGGNDLVATHIFVLSTPILREMIQFDEHIFSQWVKNHPTR